MIMEIKMYKENITWRDVLDCKILPGSHLSEMRDIAIRARYEYYIWNDRVCPVYDMDWPKWNDLKSAKGLGLE